MAGLLLISGCASTSVVSERPDQRARELVERQNAEMRSFAALVRVKLQRAGKYDDFRVEVFSAGESRLSLYLRGFLGQSVLKVVVSGDSLLAYFTRENRYFAGTRADLDVGDLKQTSHIVDAVLALLHGTLQTPDDAQWQSTYRSSKKLLRTNLVDRQHEFKITGRFAVDEEARPPLSTDEIELLAHDRSFRARLDFRSVKFNRDIPAAKFEIELPPTAIVMSRDEVVEFLTGLTP